ncbi:MAG: GC-type dockerin domain-anchored protein [Planctomycetota bacterium]
MTTRIGALIAVCGIASSVSAQPTLLNISGATLYQEFLESAAATNDFLNVDGDSDAVGNPITIGDQLAPGSISSLGGIWAVHYTAVGSGNGIRDLDRVGAANPSGNGFVKGTASNPIDGTFTSVSEGRANRATFISGGSLVTPPAVAANPRGYAVRSLTDGSYLATNSTDDAIAGIQIDAAPTDVPITWFIRQDGSPSFGAAPGSSGYGQNLIESFNRESGVQGEISNQLRLLENTFVQGTAPAGMENKEIFGTSLSAAPVVYLVNFGTGYSQLCQTELQFGLVSGRLPNGENLAFATRDVGSGTRNAANNGICLDPSYGMGDNYGPQASDDTTDRLGPLYQASNKGGSSRMDRSVSNNRLAIGYTGAERAFNRGYIVRDGATGNSEMDVLAIKFDDPAYGGTEFIRPTIGNILDNAAGQGYHVLAPSSVGTIGDPRSSLNLDINDFDGDGDTSEPIRGVDMDNTNPPVPNPAAAAWLNNVTRSTEAFAGDPGDNETLFTPGEFLALNFIPGGTTDFVDGPMGACDLIQNPAPNQTLQDFVRIFSVLGEAEYGEFNADGIGLVPDRTVGIVYSDGVANGANYIDAAGNPLAYRTGLNVENKVAFDFNVDDVRDIGDAELMVEAFEVRNSGATWSGESAVSFEIIGDANGDGNFDVVDVRTAADGLLPQSGVVNRRASYQAVDNASDGNFFDTTLITGISYPAGSGWSCADLTGTDGRQPTPGYHVNASDGVIDLQDVDYVAKQFSDLDDAAFTWGDTVEASLATFDNGRRDLSGDMNDDQQVDEADVLAILSWLGVPQGDLDLDGDVDGDDLAIAQANEGSTTALYSGGDVNFDGIVDEGDFVILGATPELCADQNGDGQLASDDFSAWLGNFLDGNLVADINRDGQLQGDDFSSWLSAFLGGVLSGESCSPQG